MFARDGIWLPARMVASNIAQYIVAIYILFAGLALTERVSTEYDKDWAKRQANDFINKTFGTESNEEAADALVENVTSIVSQYMTAREASGTDFGCSVSSASAEEIIGTYCSSGEILVCDTSAPVNYLCPLLNEEQASGLNPEVKQALLSGSGFDETLLKQVARDAMQQAADDSVDTLYPAEKYMILAPMYIGTIIAFIMAFSLALIYIPSVTTTILRLRTGAIATLRNKEFNRYRRAADQVAVLTGSIFWGSLASELYSCWFNLWLHCFLFCKLAAVTGAGGSLTDSILHILSHASAFQVWQATAYYAQRLVALIIGILCATLVRLVIVITCRCLQYKSFYRERPGAANLSMLALEWANLAVSAGFVLIRVSAGSQMFVLPSAFMRAGMLDSRRVFVCSFVSSLS